MMMKSLACKFISGILVLFITLVTETTGQNLKPFTADDLLRIERLGDLLTFSPDGQMIAFTLQRPINSDLSNNEIFTNDRTDVWLYDIKKGKAINITNGASDKTAFWGPIWAPSGDYLAMLSTRGAPKHHIHLWIWDKETFKLHHLNERNLDVENDYNSSAARSLVFWLSDKMIVFPALASGGLPVAFRSHSFEIEATTQLWNKALKGLESTATIFESGRRMDADEFEQGKYVSYDIETGKYSDLVDHYIDHQICHITKPTVPDPNGTYVAAFTLSAQVPLRGDLKLIGYNGYRYKLKLFGGQKELSFHELGQLKNALPGTLVWTPDASKFVFIGSYDEGVVEEDWRGTDTARPNEIFVFNMDTGKLEQLSTGNLKLQPQTRLYNFILFKPFFWTQNNHLVVRAFERKSEKPGNEVTKKVDWWVLDEQKPRNITSRLKFSPDEIYLTKRDSSFFCIGDGDVWLISSHGNSIKNLTADFEPEIVSIIWTDAEAWRGEPINCAVCKAKLSNGSSEYFYFDLNTEATDILQINKPNGNAEFKSFSKESQKVVFVENDRKGTHLWLSGTGDEEAEVILEKNIFLRSIAEGEMKEINYSSLNGDSLSGWVILPVNYEKGKKYPLITWVYQSLQYSSRPILSKINELNPLNLQLAASKGYAVLFPSMPGRIHSYKDLLNGVIPAVDRVIELGIADPKKLAVMGQSNGGFSTYGLITQTDIFKAAVAMAGLSDLASIYLEFMPGYNSRELKDLFLIRATFLENRMKFGLGWKDLSYLFNSPVYYADRVKTPLLILHGDFDGVPVRQAEEFFTAMFRQGLRAKFVYYSGEGHLLQSPANIKHMWQQIFDWFDEHLDVNHEK